MYFFCPQITQMSADVLSYRAFFSHRFFGLHGLLSSQATMADEQNIPHGRSRRGSQNPCEKKSVSICVICGAKKHFRKFRIFSSFSLCPPMSVRIPLAASFLASRNATTIPAGRKSIFNSFSSSVHLTRGLFRRRGRARCRVRRRKRGGQ